ncbi:FABP family protein [Brachybacterium sp. JHP9]|uniref:FABP family protein n=1 Tax=Brachybacterium equifaecis TaxID=2910770 RepID=A0ABT0QXJ0_9MICO|nr:FABP family protein [Brachybacterium equifaecis]MCL6422400.1 FABP family protein [Brachybacterium equifaecis]
MPIVLDPSLPESLYPLAWLVGSWSGTGAAQVSAEGGELEGRSIEQRVVCTPGDDGTLAWVMSTDQLDAPPPLPPTSVFANGPEAQAAPEAPADSAAVERSQLVRERGFWRVGEPLPGQDLAAAQAAKPGDPAGIVSYAVELVLQREDGEEIWAGEVRGPRIQLGLRTSPTARSADGAIAATRMFGLVGGRMFWLWERALDPAAPDQIGPFLSVELDRG